MLAKVFTSNLSRLQSKQEAFSKTVAGKQNQIESSVKTLEDNQLEHQKKLKSILN